MARFQPTIDIWAIPEEERHKLQPGQYVTAGPEGPKGRFWGQGRASTVVAWLGNAKGKGFDYHRSLRLYAVSVRA